MSMEGWGDLVLIDGLSDVEEAMAASEYFDAFRWDPSPDPETMTAAEFMGLL